MNGFQVEEWEKRQWKIKISKKKQKEEVFEENAGNHEIISRRRRAFWAWIGSKSDGKKIERKIKRAVEGF